MAKFPAPLVMRLPQSEAEMVRRNVEARLRALQALPASSLVIIGGVELADGEETPVAHGLGRPALWARESCPRGALSTGRVEEVRGGSCDRSKYVVLKATGWGATITVDVAVM